MQMKQTIGNKGVKHNVKFEEQKNGIIKDHKVKMFAGKESLKVFKFGLFSLINNISSNEEPKTFLSIS